MGVFPYLKRTLSYKSGRCDIVCKAYFTRGHFDTMCIVILPDDTSGMILSEMSYLTSLMIIVDHG